MINSRSILIFLKVSAIYLMSFNAIAKESESKYSLDRIVLPSDVEDLSKAQGSIFYSAPVKNKVLIPIYVWGSVSRTGLHFVPVDSSYIDVLSFAGGPKSADLSDAKLIRNYDNGKRKTYSFDLEDGESLEAYKFKVQPDDTIFLEKDTFSQDRGFYISLIGVFASIISTFVLFREFRKTN